MSVLIYGSLGLDHVKTQTAEHHDLLGGAAAYAACAASFYTPVQIISVVGEDFPEKHITFFKNRKVDLTGVVHAKGKTFRWGGEYELNMNNRHTTSVELNVLENFTPKVPAAYQEADFVFLSNNPPRSQALVLDQLKKPKFVLLDTIDFWIQTAKNDILSLVKRVDMMILNDSEARLLTDETNIVKAGRKLLKMGPRYVVIKKGEHGAILFAPDQLCVVPAVPLESIVDPTGAGDCFAGALIGYCAAKNDTSVATLREALIEATLVASFNVEAFSIGRLETLTPEQISTRRIELKKIAGLA